MNDLVCVEHGRPVTTSMLIAEGVGTKHEHVLKLLKVHCETKILFGFEIRKVSTKGRPMNVAILDEVQATFLITLMANKPKVVHFKEALVLDFFDMRSRLMTAATNQQNKEWIKNRDQGKASRRIGTDVIKNFVEYAKAQGSSKPDMYYMALSKMENKALWIVEGNFKSIRDMLNGQQLTFMATADIVAAKALQQGMSDGDHYKDIYVKAKDAVMAFADLVGKTPVPMLIEFQDIKLI